MKKTKKVLSNSTPPVVGAVPEKPTIGLPRWSTASPETTTVEPLEIQKDVGWTASEKPGFRAMNWLMYSAYKWFDYLVKKTDNLTTQACIYNENYTYVIGDVAYGLNGTQYVSIANGNQGNAVTDGTKWRLVHSQNVADASGYYSVGNSEAFLKVTGSDATFITLPAPSVGQTGRVICIKNMQSGGMVPTVNVAGGGTIDGGTSITIGEKECITLKCTSTAWLIQAKTGSGGGGLTTVPLTIANFTGAATAKTFTGESGKSYLVDMTGAVGTNSYTLKLPAGAGGVVVEVQVENNTVSTARLKVGATSPNKIYFNETDFDEVEFPYISQAAKFSWNGGKYFVDDGASPLNGTFAGALTVTGPLTPSGGIMGKTDGLPVAELKLGETKTSNNTTTQTSNTYVNASGSISLGAGRWLIFGTGLFSVNTGVSVSAMVWNLNVNGVSGSTYCIDLNGNQNEYTGKNIDMSPLQKVIDVPAGATHQAFFETKAYVTGSVIAYGAIQAVRIA